MTSLDSARQALRDRQGPGARYDAAEAPARDIAMARLGTALFARRLNELSDVQLLEPSMQAGWTRAHVVADVAYHARALCRQLEAATAGLPAQPMYEGASNARDDVLLAGTLPPHALRNLFEHAAIHLDVVWRDLPGRSWSASAPSETGELRSVHRTAFERSAVLWLGAVDLDNGTHRSDLPEALRDALEQGDPRHNVTAHSNTRHQSRMIS